MASRDKTDPILPNNSATPAVCTGCGCLCDDVTVSPSGGSLVANTHGCAKGKYWLELRPEPKVSAFLNGRPAPLKKAINAAADILW